MNFLVFRNLFLFHLIPSVILVLISSSLFVAFSDVILLAIFSNSFRNSSSIPSSEVFYFNSGSISFTRRFPQHFSPMKFQKLRNARPMDLGLGKILNGYGNVEPSSMNSTYSSALTNFHSRSSSSCNKRSFRLVKYLVMKSN